MRQARIFQPAKTAMQSGRGGTRKWVLEFEPGTPRMADPLMGWIGSADTLRQVRLTFDNRDDAVAYAERAGISYRVDEPHDRRIRPKSYAANFAYDRIR